MKSQNRNTILSIVSGAVLLAFGILPMGFNAGAALLTLMGLILLTHPLWHHKLGKLEPTLNLFFILIVIFLLIYTIIWHYFAFCRRPPADSPPGTVIVLGCKIHGQEPSLMLRRRLEAALLYLDSQPDSFCIVSGGQGEGEDFTEAHVMKRFLVSHGVDPDRIYQEGRSRNTQQNLEYSLAILREENLPQPVVIATDGFHQLRAYVYSRKSGVTPWAVSGRTPFWVVPSYALRELLALVKAIFL